MLLLVIALLKEALTFIGMITVIATTVKITKKYPMRRWFW